MARSIWDFIIPQMDPNARIQRATDHPEFAAIEKTYPLKLEHLLIEDYSIKLDGTSYSLEITHSPMGSRTGYHFLINGLKIEEIVTKQQPLEGMKNLAMRVLSGRKLEVDRLQFNSGLAAFYLPTGLEIQAKNLILQSNLMDLDSIKPFLSQDCLPLESLEVFDPSYTKYFSILLL